MPNIGGLIGDMATRAIEKMGNKHSSGGSQQPNQQPSAYGASNDSAYAQQPGAYPQQPGAYGQYGNNYAPATGHQQAPQGGGHYPSSSPHAPPYPTAATGGYPPSPSGYPQHGGGGGYSPYGGHALPHGAYPQQMPPNAQQATTAGGAGEWRMIAAYGTMQGTPSIRPYPHFDAQQDAEVLRKAMKGIGCDDSSLVRILCQRSNNQRQEIKRVFKTMYGKDLVKDLKGEVSGDFEELILALMATPVEYDAQQLHKAMQRIGTRESVLTEILTTRTNAQVYELLQMYRQLFQRDLEKHITAETSGYYQRLLVAMLGCGRDESWQTDALKANQSARSLYRAGEQRLGTDEAQFLSILAVQNFTQLRLVFDEYQKVANNSIEQAISNEFSGDIKDGILAIVKSIHNRPLYFAELINASMKGLGTRDTDLIRLVVTRSEADLQDIRIAYERTYGKSLESAIAGDCSGSYKEGLVALVKGN